MTEDKLYDMLIVGGGPAGLTAALYGARAAYKVLVVEEMVSGGQIASTATIDNYPGFPDSIGGIELGQRLEQQARKFGAEIKLETVTGIDPNGEEKKLHTATGTIRGKIIILAPGTVPNTLGIPGEERLKGRGISFCATCDGAFFRNQTVVVVGGGNAAVEEALFLTRFADKVIIVHRRDKLRAVQELQDKALANAKIEVRWNSIALEVMGENQVQGVKIKNVNSEQEELIDCGGMFLYVGRLPKTEFIKDSGIQLDDRGFVITDSTLQTSIPGVFAAGDARQTLLRQVVMAVADGALAATEAGKMLE